MLNIKNMTYNNLMVVINRLMREKHYDFAESEKLARLIFQNADGVPMDNPVEFFYDKVLPKEEFERQQALYA